MPTASISSMKTMHWPPHLEASFFAFRARKRTISASMPMKVCAKPEPGIGHERRVEAGGDRLREHRLAGARGAVEENAALAPAARPLERLARLPEVDDPAHLLLGLGLSADVLELHAPVRVAGLEAADLRDPHQHQRAHEDQEVGEEEEEDEDRLRPPGPAADRMAEADAKRLRGPLPGHLLPEQELDQEDDRDDQGDDQSEPEDRVPEPRPPAVEHVLLAQARIVRSEQARPRDEAPEREVERAAKGEGAARGGDDRPAEARARCAARARGTRPAPRSRRRTSPRGGVPATGRSAPCFPRVRRGRATERRPPRHSFRQCRRGFPRRS